MVNPALLGNDRYNEDEGGFYFATIIIILLISPSYFKVKKKTRLKSVK